MAFLNGDDPRVRTFGEGMSNRAVLYGTSAECSVRAVELEDHGLNGTEFNLQIASDLSPDWGDAMSMLLRLPGTHNVLNALAAIAVGVTSEVSGLAAKGALESLRPTEKRGNVLAWRGTEIVNDTYNSNPKALEAMVLALQKTEARRRILVAGEMLELGAEAVAMHRECGAFAAEAGLDFVLGVRGLAAQLVQAARLAGVQASFVETPEQAGEWMQQNLRAGDVVLLKGSRGVQLEKALSVLA